MTEKEIEDLRESLLEIIEFYRDEYHISARAFYETLAERVRNADVPELMMIEQMTDSWLDQTQ